MRPLIEELGPAISAHHARALNPNHPHQRGTAQGPDVYMQAIEAANPFFKVGGAGAGRGGRAEGSLKGRVRSGTATKIILAYGAGMGRWKGVLDGGVGKAGRWAGGPGRT